MSDPDKFKDVQFDSGTNGRDALADALRRTLEDFSAWCWEQTWRLEELGAQAEEEHNEEALEKIRITLSRYALDKNDLLKKISLAEKLGVIHKESLADAVDAAEPFEATISEITFKLPLRLNDYILEAAKPFGKHEAVVRLLGDRYK